MDFFTHFLKSKQFKFANMLLRCFVSFIFAAISAVQFVYAANSENPAPASISSLQIERADGAIYLNSQLAFDLPVPIQDVLIKGIPLFFLAEAEIRRDRWYWYDKKVTVATRQIRLAYQPLTRKWRLNVSTGSIASLTNGLGSGLPQYFDTLADAMSKVQRISRWRIVELADLDPDIFHTVELSFRLDISQLPRPFQIGLIGQNDWNISTSKSIRFASEGSR